MTERQLQFRVGLLVVAAGIMAAGLVFRFGEMRSFWEKNYAVGVLFERAPGVERGTPVRKNGILIGSVRGISFDESHGGVNVLVEIRDRYQLRKDSSAPDHPFAAERCHARIHLRDKPRTAAARDRVEARRVR